MIAGQRNNGVLVYWEDWEVIQHRLVYPVMEEERVVEVLRLWSHYD